MAVWTRETVCGGLSVYAVLQRRESICMSWNQLCDNMAL